MIWAMPCAADPESAAAVLPTAHASGVGERGAPHGMIDARERGRRARAVGGGHFSRALTDGG